MSLGQLTYLLEIVVFGGTESFVSDFEAETGSRISGSFRCMDVVKWLRKHDDVRSEHF